MDQPQEVTQTEAASEGTEPEAGAGAASNKQDEKERIRDLHKAFWAVYKLGLGVIPITPGDKDPPLIRWSRYKCERAPAHTITWWLARWPNANPAIVTGRVSGVIVHDVDGPEGRETLAAMGGAPRTWAVLTRKGCQFYYRYPAHLIPKTYRLKNFVKLLPGFDLRVDGAYAMAPGAIHPEGGVYKWAPGLSPYDVDLADPPDWLMALIEVEDMEESTQASQEIGKSESGHRAGNGKAATVTKPRRINQTYAQAALRGEIEKVSTSVQGTRNDQLNRSAFALGQLIAVDLLDRSEVERELEVAARACGLDSDPGCGVTGIRATIASGLRAGMRRPRRVPVGEQDSRSQQRHERDGEQQGQQGKQEKRISLAALVAASKSEGSPASPASRDLPMIDITNRQLRDITADALKALIDANDPPRVFLRSGDLVRVRTDEHGRIRIEILRESHVCGRLARVANFVRYTKTGEVRHVPPPILVVRDLTALGRWDLPVLEGVVEAPTMRPDGSILDTPGYDVATRLLYIPAAGLHIPSIPMQPSREEVRRSLALLDDGFGDFPYVDEASRANMLALLLTFIVRQLIKSHAPLAIIDAPRAGTGKTLAVEAVSQITTGRTAALMSAPAGDEEFRKRLTSVLMDGPTVVTIDNVENKLSAPSLASVLTAFNWHDRMLGSTSMVTLPQRATWIATGNNIKLGGDMPRRCYWIRLDSQLARPWQRPTEGFRHPNLLGWVGENRGALLAALLTIARAWFVAGKPAVEVPPLGSFEVWARTVGGILAFAGVGGFLQNLDALYEQNDEETGEWEAFLLAWSEVFGEETITVADLCDTLLPAPAGGQQRLGGTSRTISEEQAAALREALPSELAEGLEIEQKRAVSISGANTASSFRRKLGKALAKRVDVRYGDLRLERASDHPHSKVSRWRARYMRDLRY